MDETSIPTTATVGLIKIGEILSSQSGSMLTKGYTIASSYSNVKIYWTITPNSNSRSWFIDNGYLFGVGANSISSSSISFCLRPVIVVNSDVTIIGGSGTWSNPYQI